MTREEVEATARATITEHRSRFSRPPLDIRGDPIHTVTANSFVKRPGGAAPLGVVSAFLKPRYGEREGQEPRVLDAAEPYPTVVPTGNGGDLAAITLQKMNQNGVGASPADPLVTVMAGAPRHYEVAAFMSRTDMQSSAPRTGVRSADQPAATITSAGGIAAAAVTLDEYYGVSTPGDVEAPLRTVTDRDRHGINAAFLEQANTGVVGHSAEEPVSTILAAGCHQRLTDVRLEAIEATAGPKRRKVLEFLWKHFGEPSESEWAKPTSTMMGRLRFGLVILAETVWQIADIGMRMLVPRELFNAQGFPTDYKIDAMADGTPVTKTAQTSMAGNSVSPPPAEATLRANLTWMDLPDRVAA